MVQIETVKTPNKGRKKMLPLEMGKKLVLSFYQIESVKRPNESRKKMVLLRNWRKNGSFVISNRNRKNVK